MRFSNPAGRNKKNGSHQTARMNLPITARKDGQSTSSGQLTACAPRGRGYGHLEHLQITQRWLQKVTSMTSVRIKELYLSPNGDRWTLCRNSAGSFTVSHQPNTSSGGRASETELTNFLSKARHGPEHQALLQVLTALGMHAGHDAPLVSAELPGEALDNISRTLGRAVAQCWSNLPQDVQQELFEAAVKSGGEAIRQQLAIFLHDKHARTQDAMHAQATHEPDSLGG